jgi:hypothetical protein
MLEKLIQNVYPITFIKLTEIIALAYEAQKKNFPSYSNSCNSRLYYLYMVGNIIY